MDVQFANSFPRIVVEYGGNENEWEIPSMNKYLLMADLFLQALWFMNNIKVSVQTLHAVKMRLKKAGYIEMHIQSVGNWSRIADSFLP